MGKRKVKVEAKPQFSESEHAEMEANPLGMRVAMGLTKPQPMSDARLKHVREIMERGACVGIELSHSLTQEVLNEIDRLRAEVAAKDAALSAADKLAAACANSLKPPERIQIDMPELVLDYKRARKATP